MFRKSTITPQPAAKPEDFGPQEQSTFGARKKRQKKNTPVGTQHVGAWHKTWLSPYPDWHCVPESKLSNPCIAKLLDLRFCFARSSSSSV
jgi:hypothetical protein